MTKYVWITLVLFLASFSAVEYRVIAQEGDEIESLNFQLGSLQHDTDACRAELNAEMK